mgnify:CR=1 FL=1
MKRFASLAAFAAALMCGTAQAQQMNVKIGVMSDMSSLYADIGGPNSVQAAKEAVLKADLFLMRDAIDQYYADKGTYPASLQSLVSEGYLRRIPDDPITRSADSWTTTNAEFDPGAATGSTGIYDVKSGADGVALDGSRYVDWH